VLPSLGEVTLLAIEVSVVLLGPRVCRITCASGENGVGKIESRRGARERTNDDRNDPIANLGGEASVSVEQVTLEKVLGGALPDRRDSCEDPIYE